MGSGEYEGKFEGVKYGWLDLIETHSPEVEEEHSWKLTLKAEKQASKLQHGDHIIVEVEFENYYVVKIWGPDSGRMLRQRIDLLTKAVASLAARRPEDYSPLSPEIKSIINQAKDLE